MRGSKSPKAMAMRGRPKGSLSMKGKTAGSDKDLAEKPPSKRKAAASSASDTSVITYKPKAKLSPMASSPRRRNPSGGASSSSSPGGVAYPIDGPAQKSKSSGSLRDAVRYGVHPRLGSLTGHLGPSAAQVYDDPSGADNVGTWVGYSHGSSWAANA